MRNEKWITAILLLLLTISAAAQDVIVQRGCRVGKLRPREMALRRGAQEAQPIHVGGDFYHGDRNQLTVLVSFSDQQFLVDDPMPVWNNILNGVNYTEGKFCGSAYDYFYAQSDGQFRLHFDIQCVVLDQSRVRYHSTGTYGDDENSQYLVQDIMEVLKTRDIDWSLYDWNGDDFVNQLLIIYAGKGQSQDGDDYTIWPHQWWMSSHRKDYHEPTYQPDVYCDPIPVTYGEKQYIVDCYCAVSEEAYGDYRTFGILCHEYSHCFGFPDFYGTNKTPHYWDLMDSSYNSNGFCPGNYSGHERMMMGWLTPTPLTTTRTVSNMPANDAYIIRNEGFENEYYMVENRQKTGWDSYLIPANNQSSYYYEANWAYPYIANDSLTNNSKPAATLNNQNTDGTYFMSKSLRDISVTGGLASFRFTVDGTTGIDDIIDRKPTGPSKVLYQMGPVLIVREQDGTIRKIMKR